MAYYRIAAEPEGQDACLACYDQKSTDYQTCRKIPYGPDPVTGGKERQACFRAADAKLVQCLQASGCVKAAGEGKTVASIGTEALVGAGVVWGVVKLFGG